MIYRAMHCAHSQLQDAIEAKEWDAARAWLRPGIAYQASLYDDCERKYPAELGETARQGRADALRQAFWCILVKVSLPWLRSPSPPQDMIADALRRLNALNGEYPLARVALDDDRFGDGTVLDVWLKDLGPHLTHLHPGFARYEDALRARSPLPFDARLALAQGLHPRLGESSEVRHITDELARMILNSHTARRTNLRLRPNGR